MRVQAQGKRQLCAMPDPFLLSWSRMAANSAQGKRSLRPALRQRGVPADRIRIRGDQANTPCADWLTPLLHGLSARQDTGEEMKSIGLEQSSPSPGAESGLIKTTNLEKWKGR